MVSPMSGFVDKYHPDLIYLTFGLPLGQTGLDIVAISTIPI